MMGKYPWKGMTAAIVVLLGGCETVNGQPTSLFGQSRPAAAQAAPAQPVDQTAQRMAAAQRALEEAERELARDALARGLGPAIADALDPIDGFVVRPGKLAQGGQPVVDALRPPPNSGQLFLQPDRAFVSRSGDLGLTSGRYVQVLRGAEAMQGRYTIVWRRDADGKWRPLNEVSVADPPIAAPRVETELRGGPPPRSTTRRRR